MRLRSIVDAKISPAGDRVAYVVSQPSVERNAHETSVFVVPSAGGDAVRIGTDITMFTPALPAPRLRWLPDGRSVSLLGLVAGRPQVVVAPVDGGASRPFTLNANGVTAYEWSADGGYLAFAVRDPTAPRSVVRLSEPEPATRLWLQNGKGTSRVLTPETEHVHSFSWTPDGREIVYASTTAFGFTAPYFTRLHAVTVSSGARRTVVDRAGMNTSPQVSPDGRLIAFVSTNGQSGLMAPRGLAVVSIAGGSGSSIRSFHLDGAWIGEMTWSPDSQSLYVLMNEGTFATGAHMFEMPVVRVALTSGTATAVVKGRTVNYSISVDAKGEKLAYRAVEGRTMGDLYVQDLRSGARTQVTDINPELSALSLGALEPISWRSFDGMEIWGLLLTPPDSDRRAGSADAAPAQGRRTMPLIVYCHGGPIGGVTYGMFPQFAHTVGQVDPYPTEALASAGYAVLFPMPRGGSGYGEAGHRAIINAWGDADYKDIMAGVDHLVARKIADPNRLGVMGASYGGYMTNWIVTQTNRFKAASSGASISDLSDMYYLPDGGDLMVEYFKKPWENRDTYVARSPLTHADKVNTPLLLQHGERDPRVPVTNAQKFYRALKALGKTVEYDFYPRGGHVYYEPIHQRESMQRTLAWFQRWIPTSPRQTQ